MKRILAIFISITLFTTFTHAETTEEQASQLATKWFHAASQSERDEIEREINALTDESNAGRFAAGAIEFVEAFEFLGQAFYAHGFFTNVTGSQREELRIRFIPDLHNPSAAPLNYAKFREILQKFQDKLAQAEAKLALVTDTPVAITTSLTQLRLNIKNQDDFSDIPSLLEMASKVKWRIGGQYIAIESAETDERPQKIKALEDQATYRFDNADALWMRSYAHQMIAYTQFWLAHDFEKGFNASFHALFPEANLPLQKYDTNTMRDRGHTEADMIAYAHLIDWPVIAPAARKQARIHWLKMAELRQAHLKSVLAETDDEREWLPGPQQTSDDHLFRTQRVTDEKFAEAQAMFHQFAQALKGEKLLHHPRFQDKGFDLHAFFNSDANFNLVLMIAGPDAIAYMKPGDILSRKDTDKILNDIPLMFELFLFNL